MNQPRYNFTPDHIEDLLENEIFVFGSNLAGRHGRGAALTAKRRFGARTGLGSGLSRHSYAIPTKDCNLNTLPLREIGVYVEKFLHFARNHNSMHFYVTKIGCGLAKHKIEHIAPMFLKRTDNVIIPREFHDYLVP